MFQFLRKMIVPLMMFVLVAFIATIIFSWGGGGFGGRTDNVVGVIDGYDVTLQEFEGYHTNLVRQERAKTPDQDIPSEKSRELREQAWNQLVADKLMMNEVEKNGIYVTQKEIFDFIAYYPPVSLQSAPQFMTDGKFDYQKYVNAMPIPENAPFWAQVEASVTPDLLKRKLVEDLYNSIRITPAEIMEEFLTTRERVKIGYINVSSDILRATVPQATEEEKKEYYDNNKSEFEIDERAVLEVVKFDKTPSDNDWTSIEYELQAIYDTIMAGAEFAEMAQIFSEDGSAASGGDLGWFAKGRMVPPFDSAVFSMKKGDISKPIKTQFGWHLINLIDKKTERETPRGQSQEQNADLCRRS